MHWRSSQRSPRPSIAGFKGLTSEEREGRERRGRGGKVKGGREGKEEEGRGWRREGEGGKEREGKRCSPQTSRPNSAHVYESFD